MSRWAELLGRKGWHAASQVAPPAGSRRPKQFGGRAAARLWVRLGMRVALATFFLGELSTHAAGTPSREYDLKAALLFNFTRFVEWPPEAFPQPDTRAVIGVLGQDPFGAALDEIVRDEKWAGRAIGVERFRYVEPARNCQILFIAAGQEAEFPHIIRMLRGRPVLTVGEFEGFAARGGMIQLMKEPSGKITLKINLEALKASGLIVSAKLLQLAEVVGVPEK
jgi:hypothetical protein